MQSDKKESKSLDSHINISIFSETSKEIMQALAKVICKSDWKVTINDKEILAVEDAGIHMCLKKLAILDKTMSDTLGEAVCEELNNDTVSNWFC